MGSVFGTRYAPGIFLNANVKGPQGKKYAPMVENYDEIEKICQDRGLQAFSLNSNEWGVNVQMGSGSTANLAVFLGVLQPKDRIMSMEFQ